MAALEPSLDLWPSIDSRKKKSAPSQPRGSDVRYTKRPETHDATWLNNCWAASALVRTAQSPGSN